MRLLCRARDISFLLLLANFFRCQSFIHHQRYVHSSSASLQSRSLINRGSSRLYALKKNQTIARGESDTSTVLVPDVGLLVADLFGLAIIFQLLGLLDAINMPDFLPRGGWLQPLPSISESTLGVLIQRYALNSIVWIVAAVASKGYQGDAVSSVDKAIGTALKVLLIYSLGRVGLEVAMAAYQGSFTDTEVMEALRECYFVALVMTTTRYLIHKLYYG